MLAEKGDGHSVESVCRVLVLSARDWRNFAAFWLLGCLNNTAYVIMNAGANDISSGGIALVYICNVGPSLVITLTLPYWAHLMSYRTRVIVAMFCMVLSFALVAFGTSLGMQLLGVGFSAVQSGLGEASMLGLTAKYNPHTSAMLTAWSSGTGFAGIFGYAWVFFFHNALDLSFGQTLMLGYSVALAFLLTYFLLLTPPPLPQEALEPLAEGGGDSSTVEGAFVVSRAPRTCDRDAPPEIHMSIKERFLFVASLWQYTVPLFIVYFSEYAMQSGAWVVIGFPVESKDARSKFYTFANWTYQAGVFVSRSSGMYLKANVTVLWLMPFLQAGFLLFFVTDALWLYWWDFSLLVPCFCTGLLGGAVYVNAFTLIARKFRPGPLRELALTAAGVGNSLGVLTSDVTGLFIQACLFKAHDIPGADVSC